MKRFVVLSAIAFFFLVSSASCTSNRYDQVKLEDRKNLQISLESRTGKTDRDFDHPVDLDPQLIRNVLADLHYPEAPDFLGDPEDRPIFQRGELERLAPAVSDALQKADADQRVRFVSFNKGGGLIFEDHRRTEAIAFVEGGVLNVAFSTINEPIEIEDTSSRISMPENRDPLDITTSSVRVIPKGTYMQNYQSAGGTVYPLWVEAELARVEDEVVESVDSEADFPGEEIKTKLRYLKELYEEGLISETEYQTQKKELLEQIR